MGLLTLFKKQDDHTACNEHIESLKSMIHEYKILLAAAENKNHELINSINIKLDNIKLNNINNNVKVNDIELTKLESSIWKTYLKHNPKHMKQLSKLTSLKVNSLIVYKSKMKSKGYSMEFDK